MVMYPLFSYNVYLEDLLSISQNVPNETTNVISGHNHWKCASYIKIEGFKETMRKGILEWGFSTQSIISKPTETKRITLDDIITMPPKAYWQSINLNRKARQMHLQRQSLNAYKPDGYIGYKDILSQKSIFQLIFNESYSLSVDWYRGR